MKIGIAFANIAGFGTGEGAAELASAAEAAGVESLWTVEHVIFTATSLGLAGPILPVGTGGMRTSRTDA